MKQKCGIYKIENLVTGRVYVGSSNHINRRWELHKKNLQSKTHFNSYLQNSYTKYGVGAFKFSVVEECEKEKLIEREQFWFEYYRKELGVFNLKPEFVNNSRGIKLKPHSEETKQKIRQANLGKKRTEQTRRRISEAQKIRNSNSKKPFSKTQKDTIHINRVSHKKRPPISDETRAKMRESSKKRPPISDETRAKMRKRKHTEETKRKIGEKSRGRTHTEEAKQKIGKKGKKMSEESRQKIREFQLGRKRSKETRQKMSEAKINFWREKWNQKSFTELFMSWMKA